MHAKIGNFFISISNEKKDGFYDANVLFNTNGVDEFVFSTFGDTKESALYAAIIQLEKHVRSALFDIENIKAKVLCNT